MTLNRRLLLLATLLCPLGIVAALLFSPELGGVMLGVGTVAGLWGLHRLGRQGPDLSVDG